MSLITAHPDRRQASAAAGFTLIEVLLTMVILSVGLLALAAMQIMGLKSTGGASYRSIATQVAAEMAERMRINSCAVDALRFRSVTRAHPATDCDALPNPYCGAWRDGAAPVNGAPCNSDQMANYDINVMFCGEAMAAATPSARTPAGLKLLPGGDMTVVCHEPCDIGSTYTVTVSWSERPDGADAAADPERRLVAVDFKPATDPNWYPAMPGRPTPCAE